MIGIQTRLNLNESDKAELSQLCFLFQKTAQSAYKAFKKCNPDNINIVQFAKSKGLTSHQANSAEIQVQTWFSQDLAEIKERIERIETSQLELEKSIKKLTKNLKKEQDDLSSIQGLIKNLEESKLAFPFNDSTQSKPNKSKSKPKSILKLSTLKKDLISTQEKSKN